MLLGSSAASINATISSIDHSRPRPSVILPAQEIRKLRPLDAFVERKAAFGTTYGLGPAGYDVRIAETIWLWLGRFLLASTIEHFDSPTT